MATSGTTTFELDIHDIIEEAYERVGVESRNGYDLKTAGRSLDLMMREWQNRGINFWTISQKTESVSANDTSSTLDADTVDVLDAVWRTGTGTDQNDRTMTRISVSEWSAIANKNQTGSPTLFWVNRVSAAPVAYLWPIPDTAGTFAYWALRQIEDGSRYSNTMDVPVRFNTALVAGLAYYLAMKTPSAIDRLPDLATEYERQFSLAAEEDRERASLYLTPDMG